MPSEDALHAGCLSFERITHWSGGNPYPFMLPQTTPPPVLRVSRLQNPDDQQAGPGDMSSMASLLPGWVKFMLLVLVSHDMDISLQIVISRRAHPKLNLLCPRSAPFFGLPGRFGPAGAPGF